MKKLTRIPPLTAGLLLVLLATPLLKGSVFAAEMPVATAEMSPVVASGLNAVIALIDEQKLAEAAAAMQSLRAELEAGMTSYEKLVMLQTSGNLNALLMKYAEAVTDYEALLQMPTITATERQKTATLAGQLYVQMGNWNKALEHLLFVADTGGGSDKETLLRVVLAYRELGQHSAAIPFMERVIEAGTPTPDEYQHLAELYIQASKPAQAIDTYKTLLESAPNAASREAIYANLGALYIQVDNKAK